MDTGSKQEPVQTDMEVQDEGRTHWSPGTEAQNDESKTERLATDVVELSLPSSSNHTSPENKQENPQKTGDKDAIFSKKAPSDTVGIEARDKVETMVGSTEGNGNTLNTPTQKKADISRTTEQLLPGSSVVGTSNASLTAEKDPVKSDVGGHSVGVRKSAGQLPTVTFERDYSRGMMAQFATMYPEAFDGLIAREILEGTIAGINEILWRAESTTRDTVLEGVAACLSFYLIYLFKESYYSKCLVELDRFIAEQNDAYYLPVGLEVQHPIESGFRIIQKMIRQRGRETSSNTLMPSWDSSNIKTSVDMAEAMLLE